MSDRDLEAMVRRLSHCFDDVDRRCQRAVTRMRSGSMIVRYEDILRRTVDSDTYRNLLAHWGSFDWERACRTLEVQHQPRGHRLVDEGLIARLCAARA